MQSRTPNIIFIASASRSGSTVLDQALGAAEGVFNVGELRRLKDFANLNIESIRDPANQRGCTCGSKISDCAFWKEVEKEAQLEIAKTEFSSQLGSFHRTFFKIIFFAIGPSATKWISGFYQPFRRELTIGENCFKIYTAISKITNSEYIVDSSKLIHQYLVLKTVRFKNVNLLALFRDGRAVSKSMIRGERIKFFKKGKYSDRSQNPLRAAIFHWCNTCLHILLFYMRTSSKERLFVRYEDFCSDPKYFINRILHQFGKSNLAIRMDLSAKQDHNIGGSPSRFRFDLNTIKLDDVWKKEWGRWDAKLFAIYGGLMNKILGYQ